MRVCVYLQHVDYGIINNNCSRLCFVFKFCNSAQDKRSLMIILPTHCIVLVLTFQMLGHPSIVRETGSLLLRINKKHLSIGNTQCFLLSFSSNIFSSQMHLSKNHMSYKNGLRNDPELTP